MKTSYLFFFSLVLLVASSCTREVSQPAFGHECFRLEKGQQPVEINETIKAEFWSVIEHTDTLLHGVALNKFYGSDVFNTVIGVALDRPAASVYESLDRSDALYNRQDDLGGHYFYHHDSLATLYLFVEQQDTMPAVLYWNYAVDSALIRGQFENREYYSKKFECE